MLFVYNIFLSFIYLNYNICELKLNLKKLKRLIFKIAF